MNRKISVLFSLIVVAVLLSSFGNVSQNEDHLIFHESFESMENWIVEQMPGGTTSIIDGKLDIDDLSGCTVWYKKEMEAPFIIEYEVTVINENGSNDRVSDLNCFWLAKDMTSPDDFFKNSEKRAGKFQNYHDLRLYYVGLGGHDNSKTRFRRYEGNGSRPILPEHDLSDPQYLITANKCNQIRIEVLDTSVQYYYNGKLVYDVNDPTPYKNGYFGFRTYKNHMKLDNFKIFKTN